MELVVSAYDWIYGDIKNINNGNSSILAWVLDKNSVPMLLRIQNFPLICYLELPQGNWNNSKIDKIMNYIKGILKKTKVDYIFQEKKKLYYFLDGKKTPMIKVIVQNFSSLQHLSNLLKKSRNFEGIGEITINILEDKISPVRKLLTEKNCQFCQWFKIKGDLVPDDEKICKLKDEYYVDWKTLTPLSSEETKGWKSNPRILCYDIETYSDNHKAFPDKENPSHCVTLLSCVFQQLGIKSSRQKYIIGLNCDLKIQDVTTINVKTEKELCDKFMDLIEKLDPEILSGYNIFGYDNPYLDSRLKRKNNNWNCSGSRLFSDSIDIKLIHWSSSAYGNNENNILSISGRISIDLLTLIKRDYKLQKFDLGTVGNFFVNRGKHDVKPVQMFESYEDVCLSNALLKYLNNSEKISDDLSNKIEEIVNESDQNMNKVALYCIEDSELVLDIFEKINAWIGLVEMSNIVGVTIMEVFTRGQQIRGLSQIYDFSSKQGFVIDQRVVGRIDYDGGFVYEPIPGLYDNIICLDFNSLYPSIMQANNICHTSLIPPESDISDDKCNVIEWEDDLGQKFKYRFIKKEFHKGILPQLLENFISQRKEVRKQAKTEKDETVRVVLDKRQLALKTSANSIYGMLGVQGSSEEEEAGKKSKGKGILPLIEGAMCTTAAGRSYIIKAMDFVKENYGAKIIYGDTDSIMISLPDVKTGKEALEWGKILEEKISLLYPDPLYMEFEKAGRMLSIRKKMYAFWLYNKDGNLKSIDDKDSILMRGIVLARRDNCKWQRDVYRKILYNILERKSLRNTLEIIVDECTKIKEGKIHWKDLSIIKGIGKEYDESSSYVMKIFSDEMKKLGTPVKVGDRVEYVVVKIEDEKKEKVLLGRKMRPIDSYDQKEPIDVKYYIDNILTKRIEQLWELGYSEEIKKIVARNDRKQKYEIVIYLFQYENLRENIQNILNSYNNNLDKTIEHIETSDMKRKLLEAKKEVQKTDRILYSLNYNIIKTLVKALDRDEWDQCLKNLFLLI